MLDPMQRWREYGEKPDYAGPLTLRRRPVHAGPGRARRVRRRDRRRADGRARLRPPRRAVRPARDPRRELPAGPHLEAGVDAFAELRIVDFGDAAVVPAQPRAPATRRSKRRWARSSTPGLLPLIIGGDHSITAPNARAVRRAPRAARPGALRHPHRHRRGGVRGDLSHGTRDADDRRRGRDRSPPLRRRSACAATGRARRSSPGRPSAGSRACSCTTSATAGSAPS